MEIILRLEEFRIIKSNKDWLENTLKSIFGILEKSMWGNRFKYFYRYKDDKIRSLETFDELRNVIITNRRDTYVLQESDSETIGFGMYLEIHEVGFSIVLFENINQEDLIQSVTQAMIDFTIDLYSDFSNDFLLGYRSAIEAYEVKGYTANQTIINDYWECDKIVDFLSLNYHKTSEVGMPEDYQMFSDFDFPKEVEKIEKGDLLIIKWHRDMSSSEEMTSAMKYRDKWIHDNLPS